LERLLINQTHFKLFEHRVGLNHHKTSHVFLDLGLLLISQMTVVSSSFSKSVHDSPQRERIPSRVYILRGAEPNLLFVWSILEFNKPAVARLSINSMRTTSCMVLIAVALLVDWLFTNNSIGIPIQQG
jgi:hypothetical protein